MTDTASNGPVRSSVPFHPPEPCPPSAFLAAPCGGSARQEPYRADELSNAEAAELQRAALAAGSEIDAATGETATTVRVLLRAEARAQEALGRLDAFVGSGETTRSYEDVRAVADRHAGDGAEDRRHRPRWARWALWLSVPAAAGYDTAFLSAVFMKLIDAKPGLTNVNFYVSLVPGLMIAVALLATGHWLGEASSRSQGRRERRLRVGGLRRRLYAAIVGDPALRTEERAPDDLPWPRWFRGLAFGSIVLVTLGLWALNRARSGSDVTTPPVAVALLLLLFSLSVIAVTVIHHNPYADSAHDADQRLSRSLRRQKKTLSAAGKAVTDYAVAAERLQTLLDLVRRRVRGHLDAAWLRILEARSSHGIVGPVAPTFDPSSGSSPFRELGEPVVATGPVEAAQRLLQSCDVEQARQRYRDGVSRLADQASERRLR